MSLNIPSAASFTETYKKTALVNKADEEARKLFTPEQRVTYQIQLIEKAFSREMGDTVDAVAEVEVLIDGHKVLFEESVEKSLIDQGYMVEYTLDNRYPDKTVAVIYPQPVLPSFGGSLFNPLAMLMGSGLFNAEEILSLLMGEFGDEILRNESPPAPPTTSASTPAPPSSPLVPPQLGYAFAGECRNPHVLFTQTLGYTDARLSPPAPILLEKKPCNSCGKIHTAIF